MGLESRTQESLQNNSTQSWPFAKGQKSALPNLLLIGAQKGGSSALAQWLFDNGACGGQTFPEWGEPNWYHKEMTFFGNDTRFVKGKDFYTQHYQHCLVKKKKFILDATPDTIRYADRVYEMYKSDPHVDMSKLKIIVSVREPISRELSMYNHRLFLYHHRDEQAFPEADVVAHANGTIKSFAQFVEAVTIPEINDNSKHSSVAHYAKHLSKWFELFDPGQILVLSYEDEVKPGAAAKRLIRDLLKHPFPMGGRFPISNTNDAGYKVHDIPCSVVDRLSPVFEDFNEELYLLLATQKHFASDRKAFSKFQLPDCVP